MNLNSNFIKDMKKVFPDMKDDWGIYLPEVKYLSPEPLVNYDNLSLKDFKNVHFVGDALSARGITVSGSQGIYVAESLIKPNKMNRQKVEKTKLEETKRLKKPDGTIISKPIEDLYPFLSREEFFENMIVDPTEILK